MAPMLYGKRGRNEEDDYDLEESGIEDEPSSSRRDNVSRLQHVLTSDEFLNDNSESECAFPMIPK